MKTAGRIAILAMLLATGGCGYFMSGKWEDDEKNWGRAFHSIKPDDVVVIHSSYWRSPHFTFECQYFFEIAAHPGLRNQLFTQNRLVRLEGLKAEEVKSHNFGKAPAWFAPGSADRYEVWIYQDEPRGHFKVLIDKQSGTIFMSDYLI